jgi:S-adenosylmethionine hydrolase
MGPVITLLTDFGPTSTAVCSGVMVGICPEATIIVINHQITRYSIAEGASTLVVALPSMPVGTHVPWSTLGWAPTGWPSPSAPRVATY